MTISPRIPVAVALLATMLAAGRVQAQGRSDRWRPWLGAGIGVGSVDVESGSADGGPIAELAVGLAPRTGFGIGARGLWYTRPSFYSSGDWRARTFVGFLSYTPPPAPSFRVTGGIGGARVDRPSSGPTDPGITINETTLDTGLEFAVPREHHFAFRAFVIREWRLGASESAARIGGRLGQWYFGGGIRVR